MYRDSISDNAQDVLADLFVIKDYAEEQKISHEEALSRLMENFDDTERKLYVQGLRELKDNRYIFIKPEPCYKEQHLDYYEKLRIEAKGGIYYYKYFNRTGKYLVEKSEHEKTVDEALLKVTKSGIYILITALITSIATIVDTFINVYSTFR